MWIIAIIVAGVIIKFLYDFNQQNQHVLKQGGMQHKYKRLVEYIKSGDPRTRILKETNLMLIIGVVTGLGSGSIHN